MNHSLLTALVMALLVLVVAAYANGPSARERGYWLDPRFSVVSQGHAAGSFIRLEDGRMMRLSSEEGGTVEVSDDGQTWEQIATMYQGEGPGRPTRDLECGLALQTESGVIIWVYRDFENWHWQWDAQAGEAMDPKLTVWSIRSLDGGRTWVDRQMVSDGYTGGLNDIIQTSGGNIVFPCQQYYPNPGRHLQVTYASTDDGATWRRSNIIDIGGHGHHDGIFEGTLTELSDGRLVMYMRTPLDRLWKAYSWDGGLTWKQLEPTQIAASNAPAAVQRLQSGRHVMVWNPLSPGKQMRPLDELVPGEYTGGGTLLPSDGWRNSLLIAVSEDDCETWSEPITFAEGPRLCYPQIREFTPGELWIGFVAGGDWARNVVSVTEEDLLEGPMEEQAEADLTIVAFGDSTTAPRGRVLTYATQIEWEMADRGRSVEVINAGKGSSHTEEARQRFEADVLAHEPDLAIIQFGINDSAIDVWRDVTEPRVPIDRYEANLEHFVAALQERGAKVILMTPNPLRWAEKTRELYGKPPYDPEDPDGFSFMLREYVERMRDIARRHDLPLVDSFAMFQEWAEAEEGRSVDDLLLDGLHPNTRAHTMEADRLLELIPRVLDEVG
ncbi:MAG: exo-alpha-sialidase [Armatimonadota bacterium]|nr:exo-alpha-sialidase [Armatimonadota bacterium]